MYKSVQITYIWFVFIKVWWKNGFTSCRYIWTSSGYTISNWTSGHQSLGKNISGKILYQIPHVQLTFHRLPNWQLFWDDVFPGYFYLSDRINYQWIYICSYLCHSRDGHNFDYVSITFLAEKKIESDNLWHWSDDAVLLSKQHYTWKTKRFSFLSHT